MAAADTDPVTDSRPRRLPRLEDVAELAGVSHQTVSRVVNNHPSVSPGTRGKVEAAIATLGYRRNTAAYEECDLVPSVLQGVREVDLSTTVLGQKLALPIYCSPTALQRLFHHDGERAVAKAAAAAQADLSAGSNIGDAS